MTIYAFQYNFSKTDSAWGVISVHRTRSGAQKAMMWHREESKKQWCGEEEFEGWDFDMGWAVKEYELED